MSIVIYNKVARCRSNVERPTLVGLQVVAAVGPEIGSQPLNPSPRDYTMRGSVPINK